MAMPEAEGPSGDRCTLASSIRAMCRSEVGVLPHQPPWRPRIRLDRELLAAAQDPGVGETSPPAAFGRLGPCGRRILQLSGPVHGAVGSKRGSLGKAQVPRLVHRAECRDYAMWLLIIRIRSATMAS